MSYSTPARIGLGVLGVSSLALALLAKRPAWQVAGAIGLKTVSGLV